MMMMICFFCSIKRLGSDTGQVANMSRTAPYDGSVSSVTSTAHYYPSLVSQAEWICETIDVLPILWYCRLVVGHRSIKSTSVQVMRYLRNVIAFLFLLPFLKLFHDCGILYFRAVILVPYSPTVNFSLHRKWLNRYTQFTGFTTTEMMYITKTKNTEVLNSVLKNTADDMDNRTLVCEPKFMLWALYTDNVCLLTVNTDLATNLWSFSSVP